MDVWRACGKDVDSAKADDLLTKLTGLRAASFEEQAHASLKSPALVVTVQFGENKQETVTFGAIGHRRLRKPFGRTGHREGRTAPGSMT